LTQDARKAIRSYWDRKAHIYTELRQRKNWFKQVDQRVSSMINAQSCTLVLDVGTGPASFAIKLAKANNLHVVCVDISKRFLRMAKAHVEDEKASMKVSLLVASADSLPFREESFDAIASIWTIHHLPQLRMERAFGEFYRALKIKGRFALVEDWASDPRTYFQQLAYQLRKMLKRTEIEEYHTSYYEYIAMIERNGLKIFDVELHPRQVDLARFESLSSERARKLLRKAEKFEEREQIVDTTFIGAVKPR
jgi:ubiquinone/menaquinone biosynthesis C-methylase UbiE